MVHKKHNLDMLDFLKAKAHNQIFVWLGLEVIVAKQAHLPLAIFLCLFSRSTVYIGSPFLHREPCTQGIHHQIARSPRVTVDNENM